MNLRVLIFDKDLSLYNQVKNFFFLPAGNIYFSDNHKNLRCFIQNNDIHVVIMEVEEESCEKISLLTDIKLYDSLVDIILIGSPLKSEKLLSIMNKCASEYLTKPVKKIDLERALTKIARKKRHRKKTLQLETELEKNYSLEGMVGKSPFMLELFNAVEKFAPYFNGVLITGEPGTGREMTARTIHNLSPVKNNSFRVFDCVSAPGSLLESCLFGGNGVNANSKGLWEQTDNGVIYLDEICEIPLSFQERLVQIISNGRKNKVKVIASSARNVKELVRLGKFKEKLYSHFNTVELHIPPLRMRAEDIPLLMRHFLKQFNQKYSKNIKGISQRVQKFFQSYEWPGNVRELKDVMEFAVQASNKDYIAMEDLPPYFQISLARSKKLPFIRKEDLITMDALEKEYITYLLRITDNNMTKTAKIMGISRSTLYNKVNKFQIPR